MKWLSIAVVGSTMLLGCGGASWMPPVSGPAQALQVGRAAWDDLSAPEGAPPRGCDPERRAWLGYGHVYCFDVPETAGYRFEFAPSYDGAMRIEEWGGEHPWYFSIAWTEAREERVGVVRVALDPGRYQVIVEGSRWPEFGTYRLRVDRDESVLALIGREDPARVAALITKAHVLGPGERRHGVYRSSAGGARTSCGLVGGDAVQRLRIEQPARVHLRAAAHFPPAIEVRAWPSGVPFGCARASKGTTHADLTVDLPAGEHIVVVDSLVIRKHHPHFDTNGIVAGAYVLDAEVVP